MQGKVISFPGKSIGHNYAGRVLALNLDKASRFQCGGFFLGSRQSWGMVPPEAQMERIHQAVVAGLLVDITESSEKGIKIGGGEAGAITEEKTNKKVYISFMPGGMAASGVNMPTVITAAEGTDDVAVQAQRDAEIEAKRRQIVLAPGMDNPEKYLLKLDTPCK